MRILKPDLRRWPRPTVPSVREKRAYYKLLTGATGYRLSMVNGTAFAWIPGIDLSPYAGQTGSNTPYCLSITDSTGKVAVGYIGAAGAAETLGTDAITAAGNRNFDAGIGNWTSNVGGQPTNPANDLKLVIAAAWDWVRLSAGYHTLTLNTLYKITVNIKELTGPELRVYLGWILEVPAIWTTTGNKTKYYTINNPGSSGERIYLLMDGVATNYFVIDDVSFAPLTDCAATGVRIVSAPDGATRNWASVEAGFNPNGTTYTVVVQHAGAYA